MFRVLDMTRLTTPTLAKAAVQSIFRSMGLNITRTLSHAWLTSAGIQTVIDVGANTGQFATFIRKLLPRAQIYAFEPLPACADELRRKFEHDKRVACFDVALGDGEGQADFFANDFSPSSSLLHMAPLHVANFPQTSRGRATRVNVQSLDRACASLLLDKEVLVKLDVQGYEDRVIRGGANVLSTAKIVITEVSFEMLYEGQPLFARMHSMLETMGFSYHGNLNQLASPLDGRILQADAIFRRD